MALEHLLLARFRSHLNATLRALAAARHAHQVALARRSACEAAVSETHGSLASIPSIAGSTTSVSSYLRREERRAALHERHASNLQALDAAIVTLAEREATVRALQAQVGATMLAIQVCEARLRRQQLRLIQRSATDVAE